jgi:hypothetical protein
MGRGAHILTPDIGNAVHIIMERSTAKTMECYVEFLTVADALATFSRLNHFQEGGRYPRIGNRHVIIEMSSQDALLKDMFPRAKCVIWESGLPRVTPNTDSYSTGFQGFLTSEELLGVIRHAENPHRVWYLQFRNKETSLMMIIITFSHPLQPNRLNVPMSVL